MFFDMNDNSKFLLVYMCKQNTRSQYIRFKLKLYTVTNKIQKAGGGHIIWMIIQPSPQKQIWYFYG